MKKRLLKINDDLTLRVDLSETNTHIYSSYKVKNTRDMIYVIDKLREYYPYEPLAINIRTLFSMLAEWKAHNVLYFLNIKRDRTKDVDLDLNEKWYRKIGYFLLSLIYLK